MREIQIMESFSHPNIVEIYRYAVSDNRVTVIMELAENGSLQKLIKGSLQEQLHG